MNRILLEEQASAYKLDSRDPRFEHVRGVLRMRVGDSFDVGVINGPAGKARVEALDKDSLSISVDWGSPPPPPPPVDLIVGMCRPATARKILATVPTLGVMRVIFVPSSRSDPAYRKSSLWESGEWRARLIEGVEQAFDTHLPELILPESLEEGLQLVAGVDKRLALDVYEAKEPLSKCALGPDEPVALAIGPERGWSGRDRRLLREAGFTMVSLSERVLRIETAVVAGLTLLHANAGRY